MPVWVWWAGGGTAVAGTWWAANNAHEPPTGEISENDFGGSLQQQIEFGANRNQYHNRCNEKPPTGLDECELAKWKLKKAQDCKAARLENTNKWWGGEDTVHSPQLYEDLNAAMSDAENAVANKCKCP